MLYDKKLSHLGIKTPTTLPNALHIFHLYVIEVENRDKILNYLRANGVMAQVHYPKVVHLQNCFNYLGYKKGDFPVAELQLIGYYHYLFMQRSWKNKLILL